jgi:adenine C2-methylase RlmN of 23S rRNA A2503 and tRNA A37
MPYLCRESTVTVRTQGGCQVPCHRKRATQAGGERRLVNTEVRLLLSLDQ